MLIFCVEYFLEYRALNSITCDTKRLSQYIQPSEREIKRERQREREAEKQSELLVLTSYIICLKQYGLA